MNDFTLDASALVKHYIPEPGATLVDHLLRTVDPERFHCLNIGALETLSIIVRARNQKRISHDDAGEAMSHLYWEVFFGGMHIIPAVTGLILQAAPLVEAHSINSTDGALLRAALDLHAAMRPDGNGIVLVTADHRLVTAAKDEGLPVFDPERDSLAKLETLIGAP